MEFLERETNQPVSHAFQLPALEEAVEVIIQGMRNS
jgi:hypothetical protein